MTKKHRRQSSSVLGEFAYFENGKHRVVQVCNKQQFQQQLMELDRKPWISRYRYQQLR